MKRKPTPAQIAARERFAEMARSGAFKRKANPMIISKQADESLSGRGSRGYVRKLLDRYSDEGHVVSVKKSRSGSIGIALDGGRMLTVESARKKLEDYFGITETMSRRANPAKKTVSQKISQLTREGYPQKQAVAIALSEQRAGKVKRNPRASNPIILVSDKPKRVTRKSNPAKPKRQRMLNISWLTAGGQREIMSVPIEFVFTHYVGNVAERFFV
ncbi:MAG: hypothetical protein EBU12_10400, partial [Microbacteriaceae bacterium]|nr:hypothetical protein [Microbacteriaceae bacterium]